MQLQINCTGDFLKFRLQPVRLGFLDLVLELVLWVPTSSAATRVVRLGFLGFPLAATRVVRLGFLDLVLELV